MCLMHFAVTELTRLNCGDTLILWYIWVKDLQKEDHASLLYWLDAADS